jgi:imidazolonepropionase-like amidohydrolase
MRAFRITAAALMLSASTGAIAQTADRIWHGGTILTMEDEAMRVEAIAEDDGTIIAVGTRAEVMKLKGPKTEVIDLKGRTLVPGFVDPHGHMLVGGLQALAANLSRRPMARSPIFPACSRPCVNGLPPTRQRSTRRS